MTDVTVSLKEYLDALRAADARAVDLLERTRLYYDDRLRRADDRAADRERETIKERFASHNDLLNKWRDATEKDRASFASVESLNALTRALEMYQKVTDRTLTLAEGKTKGAGMVGIVIAAVIASVGSAVATAIALGVFHR